MLQSNFPYGMVSRGQQQNQISSQFLLAAYKAGDSLLAAKVSASLRKDLEQQVSYFSSLSEGNQISLSDENNMVMELLKQLQQMEQYFKNPQPIPVNSESGKPILNRPQAIKADTQIKNIRSDTQVKDNK